jgi:hypothetical protein
MTDVIAPPIEPTPADLQRQIKELADRNTLLEVQSARDRFYAANPHIPRELLDGFQGGPEAIAEYGKVLAERWPRPAEAPAPLTQAPGGQQPAAPPLAALPTVPSTPSAAPPESTRVPTPSPQDVVTQQNADAARAEDIRARMDQGLATRAEALWLSQWGPTGFTAAVRRFSAESRARTA